MKRTPLLTAGIVMFGCTGCHASPNVEIVGSYFPAWMLSLVIAVATTVILHLLVRRTGIETQLTPPVLIYTSVVVILTCLIWLTVFS